MFVHSYALTQKKYCPSSKDTLHMQELAQLQKRIDVIKENIFSQGINPRNQRSNFGHRVFFVANHDDPFPILRKFTMT